MAKALDKGMDMDVSLAFFLKLVTALAIGALLGLERSLQPAAGGTAAADIDRSSRVDGASPAPTPDDRIGVRTFSILSVGGFCAAMVGEAYPLVTPVVIAGFAVLITAMYFHSGEKDPGITTEIAAVVCCVLGLLCYSHPHPAGVIALVVTALLAMKRFMAAAVLKLRRVELTDTLKFLAIILIVLPLLPNRALDPYGAFNPYKVTFLVILISGISFVGYFLTKFLGAEKGLGLTGFLGGLTSSTAVTAAMATQAGKSPSLGMVCAFATVIANATMFARVLVVTALLDRTLMLRLAWSLGTMTIVAVGAVTLLWLRARRHTGRPGPETAGEVALANPFSLGPALKFAVFFVAILFVAKIAQMTLGDKGLYLASLVSGLADVDAITLSIVEQTRSGQLAYSVGSVGITIAVVANSLVKSGIAVYSGGWAFGRLVGSILMGAACAGLAVSLLG